MSGRSFDPRPSNGGHHPNSKDCPLFFSLLFGDSFSQLHHLCLFGHKSCKASFCCFALWQNVQLAAIECSLQDQAFEEWHSDLVGNAVGSCSAQRQTVWLYDLKVPFLWLCPGNILKHKLHHCDTFSQDPLSCWQLYLTLQISGGEGRSTPSLVLPFLSVN